MKTNHDLNRRVRAYLRSAGFRPGDRLPGERELADAVGAGRAALRPVLGALASEGILERRPQAGTFLAAVPLPHVRSATVALIAPFHGTGEPGRAADPAWLARVVSAFERAVVPAGARVRTHDQSACSDDPCSVKTLTRHALDDGAEAIVFLHPLGTRETIACALALVHDAGAVPLIVSSRSYPGLTSHVYFDSGWGAYRATRLLIENGHRRIAFAGASGGHEWVRDRLGGFRHALEAAEIPCDERRITLPDDGERLADRSDGASAFDRLRALPPADRPTAVVAANDVVALGLMERARQHGIGVPEHVSVVGFDNDPDAAIADLTTLERPTEALGEAVARVLLERLAELANSATTTVALRLRPVLIERATVGPPPKED